MKITLDKRSREILKAVVCANISTGEPVGSRTIAKQCGLGVSAATVRNIMADLEEVGYITHPYTSAGRVPTDEGFRYYVNELLALDADPPALLKKQLDQLKKLLTRDDLNVSEVLLETGRILSRISNQMGLVFIPRLNSARFRHIQFVSLKGDKIMVIVVYEGGIVQHRTVTVQEKVSPQELERYGNFLNRKFSGRTLREVRQALVEDMEKEMLQYDLLYTEAVKIARRALDSLKEEDENLLYVEGASNILSHKEFMENVNKMRKVFQAFEDKGKMAKLLDRCLESEGLVVVIGSEAGMEEFLDLSLVSSSCKIGDRVMGSLGIVGPKRMDYAHLLPLMKEASHIVNTLLSG
jgi:heat-inducible transcriptional repressor